MNRSFLFKVIGILFLVSIMAWALGYVNDLILERQARQAESTEQISRSSAGAQTIVGPVLAVPYIEEYQETITENKIKKVKNYQVEYTAYVLPDSLALTGGFANEYKRLGIYKALMYQLGGTIKGSFNFDADYKLTPSHAGGKITLKPAYISMGISDTRGITGKPDLVLNGTAYKFSQGTQIASLGNGIHAVLGKLDLAALKKLDFELKFNLRGMENFSFSPIADSNTVALQSSWQHPHFNGSFLPNHSITPSGFEAKWVVSSLASSNQTTLVNALQSNAGKWDSANKAAEPAYLESLAIGFVEPINIYSQSDRATKYGLLFIGLTFAGFFVFEVLKQLRIHPAQYTLVGLAMALFYLLLVSLSEHISFAWSYIAASAACVSLLGYYLSHVLQSKTHGAIFASMLTTLYGALYGILASEDNAMLMGSLLVFGLLALTMVVTRKVDWYQLSVNK